MRVKQFITYISLAFFSLMATDAVASAGSFDQSF
jgi:hypothetical protein